VKRWIVYLLILAAVSFEGAYSFTGTDVAKLAPVEVVWLEERDGVLYLQTDTKDFGTGTDVQSALADMKASASGTVFLDTADFLLIKEGNESLIEQMYAILRPTCMLCVAAQMPDMEAVAEFLTAHEPNVTLRQFQNGKMTLPILQEIEGRFTLLA